jgi:hypothetical protein
MKIALTILVIVLAVLACGCTSTAPATPAAEPAAVTPAVTPAAPAATPDLVGTWSGSSYGHINAKGWVDAGAPSFEITDQRGLAFTGTKQYTDLDGVTRTEAFSGVITKHGEIFIAEKDTGVIIGDLVGPDTMELAYIDDGDKAKALVYILERQKN